METPQFDHLTNTDYKHIYEPAEDTFLLLDALESDLTFINKQLKPRICLEIGSGSGLIITALAKSLTDSLCLATDINRYACLATNRTAIRNSSVINVICCNLAECIRWNSIDLLVFNPPYVVTTNDELQQARKGHQQSTSKLVLSWAGGTNGRDIIDSLLKQLPTILSDKGVLYLLLLKENKPQEILEILKGLRFITKILIERKIPGEHLYVIKVQRI